MNIKQILLITFVITLFSIGFSSAFINENGGEPCQLGLSQNKTGEWQDKGSNVTSWEVTLKNNGITTVYDAVITAETTFNITSIWVLEQSGPMKYHFPSYLVQNGLRNGTSISFGYIIQSTTMAAFSISNIQSK